MHKVKIQSLITLCAILFALVPAYNTAFAAAQLDAAPMCTFVSSYDLSDSTTIYPDAVLKENTTYYKNSSEDTQTASIEMYLGGTYYIDSVSINTNAPIRNWNLEASEDGVNWTSVKSGTTIPNTYGSSESSAHMILFNSAVKASWIRLTGRSFHIYVIRVFGEESPGMNSFVAPEGITASASSAGEAVADSTNAEKLLGCDPALTLDNALYQTYWTSENDGAGTENWICYDLGKEYTLKALAMYYMGGNFDLEILTSDNGTQWNSLKTEALSGEIVNSGFSGKCANIALDNTNARYVKLQKISTDEENDIWKVGNVKFISYQKPEEICNSEGFKIVKEDDTEDTIEWLYSGKIRAYREIQLAEEAPEGKILCAGIYDADTNKMKKLVTKTINPTLEKDDYFIEIDIPAELGIEPYGLSRENLAHGCNAKFLTPDASAELGPSNEHYASNATDGDMNTKACAGGNWNYILELDLGSVMEIGQLVLYLTEDGYPLNYDVLVSEDGVEWKTVEAIEGNSTGGKKVFNFEKQNARYVRVRDNLAQVNIRQMNVKEAEVYADSFADNYELRVFAINSLTDKTPFGKVVDILN